MVETEHLLEITLSIKVVASCPKTGAPVELRPDGLVQRFDDFGSLVENLRDMTDNYFPTLSVEAYEEYFDRLRTEGEVLARLLASRAKTDGVTGAGKTRKSPSRAS